MLFLDHGTSLTSNILGQSTDRYAFIWFMEWWPWAISHHIDPLFTTLVWQPAGDALLWLTSIPLPAMVMAPVSLLGSPVLSYNLMILGAPILSAWMMYHLCLRITRKASASLIGGFLFGFSSYQMAQDLSAINLAFTAILPTLMLLVLSRLSQEITRTRAVLSASLLLICQFFVSMEIFATMLVFGSLGWLLAVACLRELRQPLLLLLVDGLITVLVVIVMLSPFLYSMVSHRNSENISSSLGYVYVLDTANLIVPSYRTALGGNLAHSINARFVGAAQEQDGYLGIPLILIIFLYARERWRSDTGKYLSLLLGLFLIASCGPALCIDGRMYDVVLPWTLFAHLPLISSAMPARFALYVSAIAAIISASWVAAAEGRGARRLCLGVFACAAILPSPYPHSPPPDQKLFSPGALETLLGKEPRILILPFGPNGPSSYWQEENHFLFAQTGGYLGFPPRSMSRFTAVYQLSHGPLRTTFKADFIAFCVGTATQYVVAAPGTPKNLFAVLASLHWHTRRVDNATIFSVPPELPAR